MFIEVEPFDCFISRTERNAEHFALFGRDARVRPWAINISPLRGGLPRQTPRTSPPLWCPAVLAYTVQQKLWRRAMLAPESGTTELEASFIYNQNESKCV